MGRRVESRKRATRKSVSLTLRVAARGHKIKFRSPEERERERVDEADGLVAVVGSPEASKKNENEIENKNETARNPFE